MNKVYLFVKIYIVNRVSVFWNSLEGVCDNGLFERLYLQRYLAPGLMIGRHMWVYKSQYVGQLTCFYCNKRVFTRRLFIKLIKQIKRRRKTESQDISSHHYAGSSSSSLAHLATYLMTQLSSALESSGRENDM